MSISTPIAIALFFVTAFVISFAVGLVLTIMLLMKASKFRRLLLDSGYPAEKASGFLPAKDQMQNFRDGVGRSLFSFEWFLISRFGKDVLGRTQDEAYRPTVESMRKTHTAYTWSLICGFTAILLAVATIFFGNRFA